ncbi:hypothetical protein TNCV_317481 [Trichonephila clavipes]|nr:hypothetical protein TNCV_317481 [Trichonephila clavipes]
MQRTMSPFQTIAGSPYSILIALDSNSAWRLRGDHSSPACIRYRHKSRAPDVMIWATIGAVTTESQLEFEKVRLEKVTLDIESEKINLKKLEWKVKNKAMIYGD